MVVSGVRVRTLPVLEDFQLASILTLPLVPEVIQPHYFKYSALKEVSYLVLLQVILFKIANDQQPQNTIIKHKV